jgi:hypothetical protein
MFLNKKFIINVLVPKLNKSFDDIIKDINNDEIKKLLYPMYLHYKDEECKKYDNETKLKYNVYFNFIPFDMLMIYYYKTNEELNEEIQENKNILINELKELEELEESENIDLNNDNENIIDSEINNNFTEKIEINDDFDENKEYTIKESYKYKITSKLINHDIEIFQTKYDSFFSCVARFHLPCVRGYYNGTETFLLPSCISAMMTMMNLDYKYFAGSKDPVEIINKYRNRGFGTFLNDKEKIKFVEYSNSVEKWKKLYNLNKKNKKSVDDTLGPIDINNDFYKPRRLLKDNYNEIIPVLDNYKKLNYKIIESITLENNSKIFKEYQKEYNLADNLENIFTQLYISLDFIKTNGYVKQLDKWFIDYGYNIINRTK